MERLVRWPIGIALLAGYAGLLVCLTWTRPLWLDEILLLLITRENSFSQRMEMIRETPGAVPLGYELQHFVGHIFGQSTFTARAPSEVFGIVSLIAMLWLAREIQVRGRLLMAAAWVLLPILLRYALEGRPYSQALALSAASTLVLFRILRAPRVTLAIIYAVLVFAALCTQPYSLFLQAGLVAPLLLEWRAPQMRRALVLCTAALGAAVAAFAPWVAWSGHGWTQYASRIGQEFHLTARLPLMLVRELSGGSYICSLSLLTFVAAGCFSRKMNPRTKRQLLAGIGASVVLALAGDLVFNYFFATRQVLFALIPMCLLAGEGWAEAAAGRRAAYGRPILAAILLVSAAVKDLSYFRDRSENWESAARRLQRDARSACILYPTTDLPQVYEYFEPALGNHRCEPSRWVAKVLLPISRYSSPVSVGAASDELKRKGYTMEEVEEAGQPIEIRKYADGAGLW